MAQRRVAFVLLAFAASSSVLSPGLSRETGTEKDAEKYQDPYMFAHATLPPVFRLGSGAIGTVHGNDATEENSIHPRVLSETTKVKEQRLFLANAEAVTLKRWRPLDLIAMSSPFVVVGVVIYMMPAGTPHLSQGNVSFGNNRDFNHRVPPGWSPNRSPATASEHMLLM